MIEDIRSVLDRTRDVPVRRTPLEVAALVADAVTLVSSRLAARNIELRTDLPADLPTVPADALSLRQVLLNLLTNAIDATPANGTIHVTAARAVRRPPPTCTARAGGVGQRPRHVARGDAPRLRALLHHQDPRPRHAGSDW